MRSILAMFVILAAVHGGAARADEAKDKRARELFDDGLRRYNIGDYDAAIAAFKESYVLSNAPLLLFSIGQAYRLKGNCGEALRFYANYEREVKKPPNQVELDKAKTLCANAPPTSAVPTPPTEAVVEPPTEAVAKPPPVEVMPPPIRPRYGRTRRTAGIIVAGTGLATLATGIYFGLRARSIASDVEGGTGTWDPSLQADGERADLMAKVLLSVGGGAMIAGGVLYYLGIREERRCAGGSCDPVSIAPTRGGAFVTWSTAF